MRMLSAIGGMVLAGVVGLAAASQDQAAPRSQPSGQGSTAPGSPGRAPVQRPPRDPRATAAPTVGTATVRGRVIDGTSGQAIPRVRVRLNAGRQPRMVMTDGEGNFTFTKVAAGGVFLAAEKATYVQAMYPDGRRSMRRSSQMIADGQTLDGITISMFKSGAISGRVIDPYGDPVEYVNLSVIRAPQPGRPGSRFVQMGGNSTNDIGEFRLGRLEAGSYILMASPNRRGGPVAADEENVGLGRTYYPGVASIDQAQAITIEKGQSVTGLEMTVLETTLSRVTGTVMTSKGELVRGGNVQVRTTGPGGMNWGDSTGTGITQDGTFEIRLQPGEYTLEAMPAFNRPTPAASAAGAPGGVAGSVLSSMSFNERERGTVKLSVGGEPVTNVVITTGPGATASGRIVFDGRKAPPANLTQGIGVSFGTSGDGSTTCQAPGRPTVNADGTFLAEHVWGDCQVRANAPGGWQVKAVLHRGTDITNRLIHFEGGQQITDLQVVFTDKTGDVTFEVSDDAGAGVAEYVALVFPADKALWNDQRLVRTQVVSAQRDAMIANMRANAGGDSNRPAAAVALQGRITATMTGGGGGIMSMGQMSSSFGMGGSTLRGLLPGDYLAIVVDDLSWEDARDPSFLNQIAPLATRITVQDGDAKSVTLRRVTLPDPSR